MSHNTTSNTNCDVTYTFNYDSLGRKTSVKVGSQTLSTNVYENDRSGMLKEVQYGNGGKVRYEYDEYDRLTGVKYDNETTPRYTYEYGANGQAMRVEDKNLNRVQQVEYDLAERPMQKTIRDLNTEELIYRTTLQYDGKNRLKDFSEQTGEGSHRTSYTYDKDDRTTAIQYDDANHKVEYTYDALNRITSRKVTNGTNAYETKYGYVAGNTTKYGAGATTSLVSRITQPQISFEYTYDSRGNILSEKRGNLTTTYVYDALGQLIRVNDPHENLTWMYYYDRGGNMTSRGGHAYTTGTLGETKYVYNYTYDTNWKDRLTSNGPYPLTYDSMGNLKTYGGWVYEWEGGRRLRKQTQDTKVVTYDYDQDGMRIRKTYSHTNGSIYAITNYTYHGKLLTEMKRNNEVLHFYYDNQGRAATVEYNGAMYTYVHNLQGDIVGIIDSTGTLVVEYKYNAWGTLLSKTGSMASTLGSRNPFRYRGYIYDDETWMYWVKSRYYYPELHRFICADTILGEVGNLISHNTYAYSVNNPIMCVDEDGKSADWFFSAVENEELYNAYWNLPLITQAKHTGFGAIGALLIISTHQDCIKAAAEEFDIEKEMIEAVLFRELICVGIDDTLADIRFKLSGKDCSTGLGQIRASTAIAAEKTVYGSCNKSVSQMWIALQDRCTNIRYVAMNLKAIMMNNDLKISANEDAKQYDDVYRAFARYNGTKLNNNTKNYASAVYKYYKAFKSLGRK